MYLKKLILGTSSARITGLGLIAMPALIDPSLAGPTDAQRKVLLFIDPDTALLLGIKTDTLSVEHHDTVRLDHATLLAEYAGARFDGHNYLALVLDATGDIVVSREVSDVNTIMFVLSKSGASKLELIGNADSIDDDAILVALQGASSNIIMDTMLDAGVDDELPRRQVAAFFAGEVFDSVPAAAAIHANGHDTEAAAP